MLGGASCPSRYSALRSGKLTPTQMIFSGHGIGMFQVKLPAGWVTTRPLAARASACSPSAAIASRRLGQCGKSGERSIIPSSVATPQSAAPPAVQLAKRVIAAAPPRSR